MLVNFSVKNWMCFKNLTELSMVASRIRKPDHFVNKVPKYHFRVLPTAVIYGANASGKSALIKALYFAREFIMGEQSYRGSTLNIKGRKAFLLDFISNNQPTEFSFTLLLGDTAPLVYQYDFAIDDTKVVYEKLSLISNNANVNNKVIFHRYNNKIEYDMFDDSFYSYAKKGTKSNQLFLNNVVSQLSDEETAKDYQTVYNWFAEKLVIIFPNTKYNDMERLFFETDRFSKEISRILSVLDTGIYNLTSEEIQLAQAEIPNRLIERVKSDISIDKSIRISDYNGNHFIFTQTANGNIQVKKFVSTHRNIDGEEVNFDFCEESDGTKRLLDLLPLLINLTQHEMDITCVVDELDRSLHTLISKEIVKAFLFGRDKDNKSQLILSTHDINLMDKKLFRLDEVWMCEKDYEGCSELISMYDYKNITKLPELKELYLKGKVGGIPIISDWF